MKKKIANFLSVLLVISMFVGCSSNKSKDTDTTNQPVQNEQKVENKQENKKVEEDLGSVVIYTPHNAEEVNPVVKEFQERTGIRVDVVAAGTGELLKRIEAESNNPLGDVMWGGGAESLDSFKEYFDSYVIEDDDKIPTHFKDKEYLWYGFSALPMVIIYNKKLVKPEEAPTSWEDLLDEKWKGKIAYADPARSGSSYTTLVTLLTAHKDEGDEGWDFVKKFIGSLDGKLISSSSGVYKGVADGEYSVGLTLEKAAMRYIKAGANIEMVYPEDGTSAAPDGIALIKGAKNIENAKKFIEFSFGKDVQNFAAKEFNWRSTRTDIDSPEGLGPMEEIKLVDYDFSWAANNKEAVLDRWKSILTGQE